MNETLFRKGLKEIKSKWTLPEKGFLAGGSIANIIWNIHTGNNAPVNDIDIYVMDNYITEKISFDDFKKKQHFKKKESFVFEDYQGIGRGWKTSEFYLIDSVSISGVYNYINYSSNTKNPQIILDSFDINCCQIGYDIESDKFYYTKDFELFLKTKELRLVNLTSPSHTAPRLIKKKHELKAILPELELDLISFALGRQIGVQSRFVDTCKLRFKERYANMYRKYESELSLRFKMIEDKSVEPYLQSIGVLDKLYYLITKKHPFEEIDNIYTIGCTQSTSFLYWVRHIRGDIDLEMLWFKLHYIIDIDMGIENYIDTELLKDNIDLLNRFIECAPGCINNLKGFTLTKQLEIVNSLMAQFENDPIVAISILETCKFENVDIYDEMTLLLLELSVRKKILEDPTDKVRRILHPSPSETKKYVRSYSDDLNFF